MKELGLMLHRDPDALKRDLQTAAEFVRLGAQRDESNEASFAHSLVEMCERLNAACVTYFEHVQHQRDARGPCDDDENMEMLHDLACEAFK